MIYQTWVTDIKEILLKLRSNYNKLSLNSDYFVLLSFSFFNIYFLILYKMIKRK